MKKISLLLAISLLISTNSFGRQYIMKLKNTESAFTLRAHKLVKGTKKVPVNFGHFVVVNTQKALTAADAKKLRESSDIAYIEPNRTYTLKSTFAGRESKNIRTTESLFPKQWGLKNEALNNVGRKSEDIDAVRAWEINKGSKDIKIAVLDTGIDWSHPNLKDNMDVNEAELNGKPGVDDDNNGYVDDIYGYDFANNDGDPMDDHNHGTHCAGIIAGVHGAAGIKGVMSKAKLIGVKFFDKNGRTDLAKILKSIDYAINRGARILSNSWGGGGYSKALEDAVKFAESKGVLFIAAAGNARTNNDRRPHYPSSYEVDNVVSVGSMDEWGRKSSFSNYGKKQVHLFAPGSNIMSTVSNGNYASFSGTSMAAPFVTGAAGLLLSENPNLTYKELKERLLKTAVKTSRLNNFTQTGRLNANKLLMY